MAPLVNEIVERHKIFRALVSILAQFSPRIFSVIRQPASRQLTGSIL